MEFVRFVSQDAKHFVAFMLILMMILEGLEQIAKALRGRNK